MNDKNQVVKIVKEDTVTVTRTSDYFAWRLVLACATGLGILVILSGFGSESVWGQVVWLLSLIAIVIALK